MLDAAHRKSPEPGVGPRKEDVVESIIFKASDVVVVTFKDVDPNFAKKGTVHRRRVPADTQVVHCHTLPYTRFDTSYTHTHTPSCNPH